MEGNDLQTGTFLVFPHFRDAVDEVEVFALLWRFLVRTQFFLHSIHFGQVVVSVQGRGLNSGHSLSVLPSLV